MTDQAKTNADDDMTRLSGWDALLDDLFGLNVRAVRTLGVAITHPARLFTAARDADWQGRYTPSLRLVFTVMAATVVLRFLWAGDDSPLTQSIVTYLKDVPPEDLPVADTAEAARMLLNQFLVLFPFTYFTCHFLMSLLVRVWGKGTPAPVRIRLYFSALIPALVLGMVLTMPYGLIPAESIDMLTLGMSVMAIVVYAATVFFGLTPVYGAGARAWRSILFAATVAAVDMVISMITFLLAFILMYV
jgi:hypothetical protein